MSKEENEKRVVTFADIGEITNVSMFDVARMCDLLVDAIRQMGQYGAPPSPGGKGARERAVVITKLQEARMWAEESTK